jgi:HEAT repeat protein
MAKKASQSRKARAPALTLAQVRTLINLDEPDYDALAKQLGPAAIPHLRTIVKGQDPMLASKAVHVVSLISDDRSAEVLTEAAQSPEAIVRVAAAGALRNLQVPAPMVALRDLLTDTDPGVRKVALRSIEVKPELGAKDTVMKLATHDPDDTVRNLASQLVSRMP